MGVDHNEVRELSKYLGATVVARMVGCHPQYVRSILAGRVPLAAESKYDRSLSRLAPPVHDPARKLDPLPPRYVGPMRTRFPKSVLPADVEPVLRSGFSAAKIGARVTKGRWKNFRIYTLTLEERATCPADCPLLTGCYGDHMHLAKRYRYGPALEAALVVEVAQLARKHPAGFAVRLHVLGDFYSAGYVRLWRRLLNEHPALHVFGFTARIDWSDPIARELHNLVAGEPRFQVRFSGSPIEPMSAVTVDRAEDAPAGTIMCPQQTGKTQCCGSCGLCWATELRIGFLRH